MDAQAVSNGNGSRLSLQISLADKRGISQSDCRVGWRRRLLALYYTLQHLVWIDRRFFCSSFMCATVTQFHVYPLNSLWNVILCILCTGRPIRFGNYILAKSSM